MIRLASSKGGFSGEVTLLKSLFGVLLVCHFCGTTDNLTALWATEGEKTNNSKACNSVFSISRVLNVDVIGNTYVEPSEPSIESRK